MKKLQRLDAETDLIPTSPMADIAFLLIIFFMITITFSATKGLDMAMPEDTPERLVQTVEAVLVKVHPNGLVVDGRSMVLGGLLPYLAPKLERNPLKPVILQTDPLATYGDMVEVYDELRQGREKLGLSQEIQIAIPTRREAMQFWR